MAGQEKRNVGLFKNFSQPLGQIPRQCFFLLVGTCLSDTRIFSTLGIDRVSASCPWVAEDYQHCLGINPCTRWTLYPHAVAWLKG